MRRIGLWVARAVLPYEILMMITAVLAGYCLGILARGIAQAITGAVWMR